VEAKEWVTEVPRRVKVAEGLKLPDNSKNLIGQTNYGNHDEQIRPQAEGAGKNVGRNEINSVPILH
jgi:hypothetical protein